MKKHLSILLSFVIIICSVISPLLYSSAEETETSYLNNAENWATYNSANKTTATGGWWAAPKAATHNGKDTIKINSYNAFVTATKLSVEKNTDYSISFAYTGGVLNTTSLILKTVGVATITDGNIVYKTSGDIYNSGAIGTTTTDWNTVSFEFNSGDNTELEFFVQSSANSTQYAENPLYLADFQINKLIKITTSEDLANAELWATYNSANKTTATGGWWAAPKAATHNGKDVIKINSYNAFVTATKLSVEKNTDYSISFVYTGGVLNTTSLILKTVGVATITDGNIVYKTSGDIYNSGAIGTTTTDWNTVSFNFNSGDNTELEFFVQSSANSTQYAENPLYLADFQINKLAKITTSEDLANAELWATYNSANKTTATGGWWAAPTAVNYNGKDAIKINSMSSLVTATKLLVEKNTEYSLSFAYCGGTLNSTVLRSVGIATIVDGTVVYKTSGDIYNSGAVGTNTADWNTVSFKFNSGDNTELELFVQPSASSAEYANNPVYLADFNIKEYEASTETDIDPDNYFETGSNWSASVFGGSRPNKNILVEGISDTTVATGKEVITWASFKNDGSVTSSGSGSSLLINNPSQTSHIKLPDIETGASYRIKFAYKPVGGSASSSVLRYVGIFDPEFTQGKITEDSSLTYSNLKTGFVAVDAYATLTPGRYRFENGVYEDNCIYGKVNTNTYDEASWRYEEIYFTANENLDNLYLLISYTTEAGKLYVDGFELEKVDSIPESQMPGYVVPSDAPTLDENGYRLIDMEKENIITSDTDYVKRLASGGYGNNGATLYLPAFDHTVTANPTKVTTLNFGTIHTKKTDPYFRTAVEPSTDYMVTVKVKKTSQVETDSRLLLYGDWYGYYNNRTAGTSINVEYSSLPLNEWTEYSFAFSTTYNQNEIAFYFNSGTKYPELYIDEVEIKEVEPLYSGAQDKTVIDFEKDESYYNHLKGTYIDIEETKGVDGNKTNALHILERPFTENTSVTFPAWSTVSKKSDPVFSIPVEENSLYTFSVWLKVDKTETDFDAAAALMLFADFRGSGVANNGIREKIFYNNVKETDWTEYVIEFATLPGQTSVTFAVNAYYYHPSLWIDNISYTKIPAGFLGSTDLTYCEDNFNLITNNGGENYSTVSEKTVIKIDAVANAQYTYGVDLSGSGKFTVAFDEAGTDILKSYDVSALKGRIGGMLSTDSKKTSFYLIFEPTGSGISYKDLYVFKKYSIVGTELEMGHAENINNRVPLKYSNVQTVVGDEWDVVLENTDSSPATGDSMTTVFIAAIIALLSALAVIFLKKGKKITG